MGCCNWVKGSKWTSNTANPGAYCLDTSIGAHDSGELHVRCRARSACEQGVIAVSYWHADQEAVADIELSWESQLQTLDFMP